MFWGFGAGNAGFDQVRQELERMQHAYGAAFQMLLGITPTRATPAEELFSEHNQRLLRYQQPREQTHPVPLLLVPSLLNQTSLLDLAPGKSLVQHMLTQGFQVFAAEWHSPDTLNPELTLDFYTAFIRRAITQISQETGQQQVSLLGYCSGGTLTAIVAALDPPLVRNLVQLAAPIDFHDGGLISQWLRFGIGDPDLTINTLAMMPRPLMRASLQMLKPTLQIAQLVALHNQLGDDGIVRDLLALQAWIGDRTFSPIEAYRTLVKSCYRQNALVEGQLVTDGRQVDIGAISAALLVVTATQDRICPPISALALTEIATSSSDVSTIELPGGHLSLLAGRSATQSLWPQIAEWLAARSS